MKENNRPQPGENNSQLAAEIAGWLAKASA
jgi:hypothetical protein